MSEKEIVLVLPNTFFNNAFLMPTKITTVKDFNEQNHYRFIANLIIEVSASLPENRNLSVTSSAVFDEFKKKVLIRGLQRGAEEILTILNGMIFIVNVESINKLGDQESMIAIANRLYDSSTYDPIIIINPDSRENYTESARRFYGNGDNKEIDLDIPFKMFDPREAKGFLEAKFPSESKQVLQRTPQPYRIF